MTRNMTGLLGAALWLGAWIGDAQAKVVSYTVDGHGCADDTRDPEQAEAAQRQGGAAGPPRPPRRRPNTGSSKATPLGRGNGSAAQKTAAAGDRVRQNDRRGAVRPPPSGTGPQGRDARRARNRTNTDRRAEHHGGAPPRAGGRPRSNHHPEGRGGEPAGAPPPQPGRRGGSGWRRAERGLTSVTLQIKTEGSRTGPSGRSRSTAAPSAMLLAAGAAPEGLAGVCRPRPRRARRAGRSPGDGAPREGTAASRSCRSGAEPRRRATSSAGPAARPEPPGTHRVGIAHQQAAGAPIPEKGSVQVEPPALDQRAHARERHQVRQAISRSAAR